jgi:hypothetical protein
MTLVTAAVGLGLRDELEEDPLSDRSHPMLASRAGLARLGVRVSDDD